MPFTLELTDAADDHLHQAVLAPLVAYNASHAGPIGNRPINVLIKDDAGAVIGGLVGRTGYGWLYIQLLVVPESLRGQKLGTELMQRAEREALARGCHGAWLDTFEFQARGFYERMGYACFGQLGDYPVGLSRFFMKKALAPTPGCVNEANSSLLLSSATPE